MLSRVCKRLHNPLEVILVCVRWYAACSLSFLNIEKMMTERGVFVGHSTLHRWLIKMLLVRAAGFRRSERPVGRSLRMDETYVKASGRWQCLYRAVDRDGYTVDFLLCAKRDHAAARGLFEQTTDLHGAPKKITFDKSGSNTAAIVSIQADSNRPTEMGRSKYLNNLAEQVHGAVKCVIRPTFGLKTFGCARILIAGIEVMHLIRKGQFGHIKDQSSSAANQIYSPDF